MGRPPKPDHLKRNKRFVLLFTDDEITALDRFIAENGYADRNDFGCDILLDHIGYDRKAARDE